MAAGVGSAQARAALRLRCGAFVLAAGVLCDPARLLAQAAAPSQAPATSGTPASVAASASDLQLQAARSLAADADAAVFGLGWRGSARAQLGAFLPLVGAENELGGLVGLAPLIELHEPSRSAQPLPSEYWRARLPLETSWGFATRAVRWRVGFALEHESDHESSHAYSKPGFLTLNAAALVLRAGFHLGASQLLVAARGRAYVLSCTRERASCQNFRGDDSAGAQLDLVLLSPMLTSARLRLFAAVTGFGVLAHAGVRGEAHLELHMGVTLPLRALDLQAFALGYLGNDVGVSRAKSVTQLGAALRLSLAQPP